MPTDTHTRTETDTDRGEQGTQGNTGGNHWGTAMAVTNLLRAYRSRHDVYSVGILSILVSQMK